LRRHQIVQQQARMTRQETEKRLGWTLGLATALLPILQGIDTDAQGDCETGLAHSQECRSKCSHIAFLVRALDHPLAYRSPDSENGLADCPIRIWGAVLIALGTETSEHRRIGSVGANFVRSFRDHAHVSPIVVERPILGASQASAYDADDVIAITFSPGYSHKEQQAVHKSDCRPSILDALAMVVIIFSDLVWVIEYFGRRGEIDAMSPEVGLLLAGIPLEPHERLYVIGV
jgi:hypothetical protein